MHVQAIVTVPPYAPFLAEVAAHPLVCGLRLNTVMPLADPIPTVLERLAGLGPPLWVDLKGRQLRVVEAAVPPFTAVRISHRIRVHTPADAFFDDGRQHARIAAVDGDRLILEDGPRRVIGPGESVNIVHPSLRIEGAVEGILTATDREYLAAMRELGLRRVMLSYVERPEDAAEVRDLLPDAELLLKIETRRGLGFARAHRATLGHLVAARGDLYVEVLEPHRLIGAVRTVLAADPDAVVASRLFPSLSRHPVPEAPDLGDAAFLMALGYRTFLLGDDVCLRRDSVLAALHLLAAVAGEMGPSPPAPLPAPPALSPGEGRKARD
jgi:pyruvate kinase